MAFDKVVPPESGEKITIDEHGVLNVPNHPIVVFAEVDETSSGIWSASQSVIDAAVEKAYAGERKIAWMEVVSDKSNLSEETQETPLEYPVGIKLYEDRALSSVILTGSMMLRYMGWSEAAGLVLKGISRAIQANIIPADSELLADAESVSASEFTDVVIECMDHETLDDDSISETIAEQYDELADRFHEEFDEGAEKSAEFAKKAMGKAREQLTVAGKFTEEQGHKFKEFMENDFSRVSQEVKAEAKEKLNPSRLGTGALASMSKILHKTGVLLSRFGDKAEHALACKSGEITSAGKLTCNACGYEMNFKKTGRIPPCPKCHKTVFTKGY